MNCSICLRPGDGERDAVFCKEPSNVGLLCADFESFVGILLNAFNSPCKRCTALFAVNLTPVLLSSKPTHACDDNNCGGYCDTPSHRFHPASILPTRHLRKQLSITGVYTYDRESVARIPVE